MFKKIILATVLLGNTLLSGQTGSISGKAIDAASSEGVAFASVRVIGDSGTTAKAVADIDGNFRIDNIKAGKYDIEMTSVGYSGSAQKGIMVMEKKVSFIDIRMETAAVELVCFEFITTVEEEQLISCEVGCCVFRSCLERNVRGCCGLSCNLFCVESSSFMPEADTAKIKTEKKDDPEAVSCKAYPNPFTEYVVFELNSDAVSSANVPVLNLYDMTGKEVKSLNFSGTRAMIGRENLSAGTYTYHVSAADKMISVGKVILQ